MQAHFVLAIRFCMRNIGYRHPAMIRAAQRPCEFLSTFAIGSNLYDLMDAAYCSLDLHEHSCELGHVPLIDHNPRGGEKEEFEPADAIRYNERTVAECSSARLKDEFGGNHV